MKIERLQSAACSHKNEGPLRFRVQRDIFTKLKTFIVRFLITSVLVTYVTAYIYFRAAHHIGCSSNAWNWYPDKWNLVSQYEAYGPIQNWLVLFYPAMGAETVIRAVIAFVAYIGIPFTVILFCASILGCGYFAIVWVPKKQ